MIDIGPNLMEILKMFALIFVLIFIIACSVIVASFFRMK